MGAPAPCDSSACIEPENKTREVKLNVPTSFNLKDFFNIANIKFNNK